MNFKGFFICIYMLTLLTPLSLSALEAGDRVKCKYSGIGSYYKGKIERIEGDRAYVIYDDGETQRVPRSACRELTQRDVQRRKFKKTVPVPSGSNIVRLESNSSSGWDSWTIITGRGKGKLSARNNGKVWKLHIDNTSVTIDTCIGGREAWMKWKYYYRGNQIIAEAGSRKYWKIDGHYTRLIVKKEMNGTWTVSGKKGTMKIYEKGRSWKSWMVKDTMPGENIHLKLAALFTIIYSSDVMR